MSADQADPGQADTGQADPGGLNALGRQILRRITAEGPLTLADYMAECLFHPHLGYYTTATPFGRDGDFVTAPEISQMFGELLGLCLAQAWFDQGAPAIFTLAELGPGRGVLMADLWRATRGVPGFHAAARLHLVEASPRLRDEQARALPGLEVEWHASADTLPDAPLFLIANEFFDALPIRQFHRAGGGWREVMVGREGARLRPGLAPEAPLAALAHRLAETAPGQVVEICPGAASVMAALEARIAKRGGAALLIDYGNWRSLGDTFQAMAGHAPTDPFAAPGEADLTAHVDFEALVRTAPRLRASGLTAQGDLLQRLGIGPRSAALARGLTGAALERHHAATRRLTHPQEMGSLFRALALVPEAAPLPPGFDPADPVHDLVAKARS